MKDDASTPGPVGSPVPVSEARRFGRFTAPAEWARQFRTELKRVMGQCIVFRAEHMFHSDQIEYWAASASARMRG